MISISRPPILGGECEIIRGCHNRDKPKILGKRVVVTIHGECEIIRGCHNRNKGTAENERLRDPKFIFSYPKNERLIFLSGRNDAQKKFRPCGWGDSQRTGERAYPRFVLTEMLMKKLRGIVGKIYG